MQERINGAMERVERHSLM